MKRDVRKTEKQEAVEELLMADSDGNSFVDLGNAASTKSVLLYIPNIIDYCRLLLLAISCPFFYSAPHLFLGFYSLSIILDAFDGLAARRLNQVSTFGAWLDIVVDNIGRSVLWTRLHDFGCLVVCLEWLTFVCNHTHGSRWKSAIVGPWWVNSVMKNGFWSSLGILSIAGLNILPIGLYCYQTDILSDFYLSRSMQILVLAVLVFGRVVCATVEIWCIYVHILFLCAQSEVPRESTSNGKSESPHQSKICLPQKQDLDSQ